MSLLSKAIDWGRRKSPWIIHFNAGACNGCDIEVVDVLTPRFDVERFGILQQGTPRHADVLVCTGAVTLQTRDRIRQIYEQMPEPKFVIAVGTCACTGGIFDGCYCVAGGIDSAIPVDVYLPGCAARPESIIDAVVKLLSALESQQKYQRQDAAKQAPPRQVASQSLMEAASEMPHLPPMPPPASPPRKQEPAPLNMELVQAWQAIAATWNKMTEKEKVAAAELWIAMGEAEKAAVEQATNPHAGPNYPPTDIPATEAPSEHL